MHHNQKETKPEKSATIGDHKGDHNPAPKACGISKKMYIGRSNSVKYSLNGLHYVLRRVAGGNTGNGRLQYSLCLIPVGLL
jgi:hypothetical protein